MDDGLLTKIGSSIQRFVIWLEKYGETSYDFHSFYASPLGKKAKALYYKSSLWGTIAVAPMVFCEAFLPKARRLFWNKQRFPIGDAHYAMGFTFLSQLMQERKYYEKALHFLDMLEQTRCSGYEHFCWGYPYDWQTRNGMVPAGTPLITTLPYAYEAFLNIYQMDGNNKWRDIMYSIAQHALEDIKDFDISETASICSYTPFDRGGAINANAYRAFLLTSASVEFSEKRYWEAAERNLNFVLQTQRPEGSWYYSVDGENDFVDHFHTCFILKGLAKIGKMIGHAGCSDAIDKGVTYYVGNLFDEKGLPKPFATAPRLTVYRRELYNYAECINLGVLLKGRYPELDRVVDLTLKDLLSRWQRPDGSFRSRELFWGWDNVPMHRWAESQVFRALCFLLYQEARIQNSEVRSS